MQVGVFQDIVLGIRDQLDALPLTRSTIVWQIVKHVVDSIATKGDRFLCRTLSQQFSIHLDASVLVEIERSTLLDIQGSHTIHLDATIDDDGLMILTLCAIFIFNDNRVAKRQGLAPLHLQVGIRNSIPRHGTQIDFLLNATLQSKDEVVLYKLWFILLLHRGSQLHEHTDAIALAHLHVTCLIARGLS